MEVKYKETDTSWNHQESNWNVDNKRVTSHQTIESTQKLSVAMNKWLAENLMDLENRVGTKITEDLMAILYDKALDLWIFAHSINYMQACRDLTKVLVNHGR